jgi:hypothetical protein
MVGICNQLFVFYFNATSGKFVRRQSANEKAPSYKSMDLLRGRPSFSKPLNYKTNSRAFSGKVPAAPSIEKLIFKS